MSYPDISLLILTISICSLVFYQSSINLPILLTLNIYAWFIFLLFSCFHCENIHVFLLIISFLLLVLSSMPNAHLGTGSSYNFFLLVSNNSILISPFILLMGQWNSWASVFIFFMKSGKFCSIFEYMKFCSHICFCGIITIFIIINLCYPAAYWYFFFNLFPSCAPFSTVFTTLSFSSLIHFLQYLHCTHPTQCMFRKILCMSSLQFWFEFFCTP